MRYLWEMFAFFACQNPLLCQRTHLTRNKSLPCRNASSLGMKLRRIAVPERCSKEGLIIARGTGFSAHPLSCVKPTFMCGGGLTLASHYDLPREREIPLSALLLFF